MYLGHSIFPLLLAGLVEATPFTTPKVGQVLHDKRVDHPEWRRTRRLEGHVKIPLRVGLTQHNVHMLPDYLMSVSDPESPSFGKHWTHEMIVDAFAPSSEANETVHNWLTASGFDADRLRLAYNKAWIEVDDATVEEVEALLAAEYHVYVNTDGDETAGTDNPVCSHPVSDSRSSACQSYSIPDDVARHVDIITPTVQGNNKLSKSLTPAERQFKTRQTTSSAPTTGTGTTECDTAITPECLKVLYNMTYTPQATDRNSFGIGIIHLSR